MQLRLTVDDRDDHAVVTATGEIDVETAGSVAEAVTESLARSPRVLLDLNEVTFIDSTGLGVIVRAHRAA